MTIHIPMFAIGVFATLLAELVVLIIGTIRTGGRK